MSSTGNPCDSGTVLVTGSAGFIGSRVVQSLLLHDSRPIRCLVRSCRVTSETFGSSRVEIVRGDLLSREDCSRITRGVAVIYHLAAGIEKSFAGSFMNSALATRNLIDAFLECGSPARFVNVSSFAVYSNLQLRRGALLDETCALESEPQKRNDAYAFGKLKQDQIVIDYGTRAKLPYVIVRPGSVFGPGKAAVSGRIGINTFGVFLHLGGSNRIPLTYVDNCADAIVRAGVAPGVEGETFNIVDDDLPTSREFLRAYKRAKPFRSVPVPYFVTRSGCSAWERYSKFSKGQLPPVFNERRCSAEWKGNRYSNEKIKMRLGWKPRIPMREAVARYVEWLRSDQSAVA
jgi:nucleoside-diphosphate-sugar epimerase